MPGLPRTSRSVGYAITGALLGTGAPAGLLLVRSLVAGQMSSGWIRGELASDPVTYVYVTVSTVAAFAVFGRVLGRLGDRLQAQAQTDDLTGLLNRRAVEARLGQEVARASRHGLALSFLLIDVDHLKLINDHLGHRGGDRALRRIGGALAEGSRGEDVCGRWGGDEFAVLAPATSGADAMALAERIRARVAGPDGRNGTVSIGVATFRGDAPERAGMLVNEADRALYRAKELGRNRVAAFESPAGRLEP